MPKIPQLVVLILVGLLPIGLQAAPSAEIKVRATSYYLGSPFNFYVQVNGVKSAPQPDLLETDALQIRYVGAAPSSRNGIDSFTFTYEAIPLKSGRVNIPGGLVSVGSQDVPFTFSEIEVKLPKPTDEMELTVELSKTECYVGEPVTLTFHWTTNLSLNGVKAADIRIPALTDYQFRVRPPVGEFDPNADNAIGLPVSNERVIAQYEETNRNQKPAVRLTFQKIIIPTKSGDLPLLIKPPTLMCSFVEPRDGRFKGTRYPSYFNNEFFDEDVTGSYQRLMVQGQPTMLQVKPLPIEGKPSNFSGIIGSFTLDAQADPLVVEVNEPITLSLEAKGHPYPHLLELPPFSSQSALTRSFAMPAEQSRPRLVDGIASFSQTLRPLRENVTAIPALEFSFFDPEIGNYGVARTAPISLTVSPVTAVNILDAEFSDGSALKNVVEPQPGGIFANYSGPELLINRKPETWAANAFGWVLAWILPPLLFGALWYATKNLRLARHNPDLAKKRRAFSRFRFSLWKLGPDPDPNDLSRALKSYLEERFDVPHFESGARELRTIAEQVKVDQHEADILIGLIDSSSASGYSKHDVEPPAVGREGLLQLVRRLEVQAGRAAVVVVVVVLAMLTATQAFGENAPDTLAEAEEFFAKANETALVDPGKAQKFYALAAERFESLRTDFQIENGELYANLANTHFLAGDIGRSILNLRRAERFRPNDSQLAESLHYVRTQRVDIFPEKTTSLLVRRLFFWHFLFEPRTQVKIVAFLFAGMWLVLGIHLLRPINNRWQIIAGLGGVAAVLLISLLIHAGHDHRRDAVIVEAEVVARKGDSFVYDPAFTNSLHSGTEVRILEQRRDWLHVRTPNQSDGWIPASSAERVLPN
tara:strand:- start:6173 stop:8791 length:2619 start_codon:yes stop_codon:yes gene_type:complete